MKKRHCTTYSKKKHNRKSENIFYKVRVTEIKIASLASENDEKHMGKNERKYEMKTKRMLNYIIYIHIYYVHVYLIRAES